MLPPAGKGSQGGGPFSLGKYMSLDDTPASCSSAVSYVYYSRLPGGRWQQSKSTGENERAPGIQAGIPKIGHRAHLDQGHAFSFPLPHPLSPSPSGLCLPLALISGLLLFFHKQALKSQINGFLFQAFSLHLSSLIEGF